MHLKLVVIILLIVFLSSFLFLVLPAFCNIVEGEFLRIYIKKNREVYPSYAPLKKICNNTYALTNNVFGNLVVECNDIVVDGQNYVIYGFENEVGMKIFEANNITVKNFNLQNFFAGIFLQKCFYVNVYKCFVKESFYGFKLVSLSDVNVTECNVQHNGFGIVLENCSRVNIAKSFIKRNDYHGIFSYFSSFIDISGNNIIENYRGIYFDFSSNNRINGNNIISNLYKGARIAYSDYNIISNNNISANLYGFWFFNSSFNLFRGNRLAFSKKVAVLFECHSDSNVILENTIFLSKEAALYIDNSYDNFFLHNNFIKNRIEVILEQQGCPNFWDNGFEGNFWDNYCGKDFDTDGIGDESYFINSENIDGKPLMGAFNSFMVLNNLYIDIISNFTLERFVFFELNGTFRFVVQGEGEFGFCRVTVPLTLVNSGNLSILIDDGKAPVFFFNEVYRNSTHLSIYFLFESGIHKIEVLDEHLITYTFLLFPAFSTIIYKLRKRYKKIKKEDMKT